MHVFARAVPQQNWTTDQPASQENERDISHAHSEDLANKNQENAGNQTSTYRGKLHYQALSYSKTRCPVISFKGLL